MATLVAPDQVPVHGFPDYWFVIGARPHLHVPQVTRRRGSVFKLITWVTLLNMGKLKV